MRKLVLMLAPTGAGASVAKLVGAPPTPRGMRSTLSVPILGPIAQ